MENSPSPLPVAEPIAVDAVEAAKLIGISRSFWLKLDSTGRIPRGFHLGRARRWSVEELRAWAAAGSPSRSDWESRQQKRR